MKKIIKYTTCSGFGAGFQKQIDNLLKKGLQPYGEPKAIVDPNSQNIVLIQVMVLYAV